MDKLKATQAKYLLEMTQFRKDLQAIEETRRDQTKQVWFDTPYTLLSSCRFSSFSALFCSRARAFSSSVLRVHASLRADLSLSLLSLSLSLSLKS